MDRNSPAPGQPQAQKPPTQPAGPAPAPGQPAGQSPQQPNPAQVPAGAPRPQAQDAPADLRTRIKTDFPNNFNTDADFGVGKVYSICSQGIRFRLERSKGLIRTKVLLISKKCGILKPEFLVADIKVGIKEYAVFNNATKKPFLTFKHNDKTQTWDVLNNEGGNSTAGSVKVIQNNEIRSVVYSQGNVEAARVDFKCPVQKAGMCSSVKPANLLNIGLNGKFRSVTLEENPNGEPCANDLEVNAYYPTNPDQNEFIALVSILNVMARELH